MAIIGPSIPTMGLNLILVFAVFLGCCRCRLRADREGRRESLRYMALPAFTPARRAPRWRASRAR
jgi:hypothetical protein